MRKILFASHGALANGLKSTIDIFSKNDNISVICAYGEFGEPDEKISDFFNNLDENDEVFVLTDISFGSLSQKIIPFLNERIHLISGMNLPLALQLVSSSNDIDIEMLVNEARLGIVYMNDLMKKTNLEDEDE